MTFAIYEKLDSLIAIANSEGHEGRECWSQELMTLRNEISSAWNRQVEGLNAQQAQCELQANRDEWMQRAFEIQSNLNAVIEDLRAAQGAREALQQQLAAAREAIDRIQRVSETGTAESFLTLSDDDKRKWFAMALDESTRLKHAEELLDSGCIVTHDRDEFGEEQRTLRCGLNLRDAIKFAMDEVEVYESIKTLQRDRQP